MLNELAKEVHQNAVEHGWWDENRSFGEIIALCHSELSEALEEHRNGHKLDQLYYNYPNEKPEGIPSELADVVIRMLDYIGKLGIDYDIIPKTTITKEVNNFGDFIALIHLYLSKAYEYNSIPCLKGAILKIYDFCKEYEIDIQNTIRIKHEYNKTRPYKHGGKVI